MVDTNPNPFQIIRKAVNIEIDQGPFGADYVSVNGQHAATLFFIEGAPTDPGEYIEWLASVTTAHAVRTMVAA